MIVEEKPGLPPPAAPGRFIGFAAEGEAFVLVWNQSAGAQWFGIGFDQYGENGLQPMSLWGDALELHIKSHVELPRGRQ